MPIIEYVENNKFMGFDCFGETSCTWACAFNVEGQILVS